MTRASKKALLADKFSGQTSGSRCRNHGFTRRQVLFLKRTFPLVLMSGRVSLRNATCGSDSRGRCDDGCPDAFPAFPEGCPHPALRGGDGPAHGSGPDPHGKFERNGGRLERCRPPGRHRDARQRLVGRPAHDGHERSGQLRVRRSPGRDLHRQGGVVRVPGHRNQGDRAAPWREAQPHRHQAWRRRVERAGRRHRGHRVGTGVIGREERLDQRRADPEHRHRRPQRRRTPQDSSRDGAEQRRQQRRAELQRRGLRHQRQRRRRQAERHRQLLVERHQQQLARHRDRRRPRHGPGLQLRDLGEPEPGHGRGVQGPAGELRRRKRQGADDDQRRVEGRRPRLPRHGLHLPPPLQDERERVVPEQG